MHANTHTHISQYIYIYIHWCVCVFVHLICIDLRISPGSQDQWPCGRRGFDRARDMAL